MINAATAETTKVVLGWANEAISSTTSDYVSFKHYKRATVVITATNAATSGTGAIAVQQATAVAGTGAKALLGNINYWYNADHAAGSDLTKATATLGSFTSDGVDSKEVVYVFDVTIDDLDQANGFDCFQVTWATTANVTATCVIYMHEARYQGGTLPSAIAD